MLYRWFEYIGDLFEDEITNTLSHRNEKETKMDRKYTRHNRKSLKTKLLVVIKYQLN